MKTGPGSLSDRVRSLRLSDISEPARSSWSLWIPWAFCALLVVACGLLAMEALSPIDDELIKKLAEERKLIVSDKSAKSDALTKLGLPTSAGQATEIALEAKGYVVPFSLIQVSPKISGTVLKLNIEEGRYVEKGFILAVIEDVEFKSDLDHCIAARNSAEGRLEELQKYREDETQQAKADLEDTAFQRDQAMAKYRRFVALKQRNSVAPEDFELAEGTYKSLESRTQRLQLTYEMMRKGPRDAKIASATADVAQAKADYDKAKWRWDNTKVTAPITGIILSKKTEEGNIVNPSAFSNGLSASLCEMANLYELEIDLSVAERDIAKVFKDQDCRIRAEAFPERIYMGRVSRIMPTGDRSKGAVPVRVVVKFPPQDAKGQPMAMEKQGEYLRPEMGAIVTFLNRKAPEKNNQP